MGNTAPGTDQRNLLVPESCAFEAECRRSKWQREADDYNAEVRTVFAPEELIAREDSYCTAVVGAGLRISAS